MFVLNFLKKSRYSLIVICSLLLMAPSYMHAMGDDADRITFTLNDSVTQQNSLVARAYTVCKNFFLHYLYDADEVKQPLLMHENPFGYFLDMIEETIAQREPISSWSYDADDDDPYKNVIISADDLMVLIDLVRLNIDTRLKQSLCPVVCEAALSNPHCGMYIEARIIPQDAVVFSIGDLHGDVCKLAQIISFLQEASYLSKDGKLAPKVYLVFLGDLMNRGSYSMETLALALLLKYYNQEHVILLQGNHELVGMSERYGSLDECCKKFGPQVEKTITTKCNDLFSWLPQACFIGTKNSKDEVQFVQYNHGGLPYSFVYYDHQGNEYRPNFLKNDPINPITRWISDFLCRAVQEPFQTIHYDLWDEMPKSNGFLWSDFLNQQESMEHNYTRQIGVVTNSDAVALYMNNIGYHGVMSLCGIVRGHQHFPGGVNQLTSSSDESFNDPMRRGWKKLLSYSIYPIAFDGDDVPVFSLSSHTSRSSHWNACARISYDKATQQWVLIPFIINEIEAFC